MTCPAKRVYPYLDDWTDKPDEWHEAGEYRPLFGQIEVTCTLAPDHAGAHDWPVPEVPQPTRIRGAVYVSSDSH